MQYSSPPVIPTLQTVHKVIDNIPSMVRSREKNRKLHYSIDANSHTTMFNFADADAQAQLAWVGLGLAMLMDVVYSPNRPSPYWRSH